MNTKSYTNKKGKSKPQDQLLVSNNIKVGLQSRSASTLFLSDQRVYQYKIKTQAGQLNQQSEQEFWRC